MSRATPSSHVFDYVMTADGWAAGMRRSAGDVVRLNERAARYEPLLVRAEEASA